MFSQQLIIETQHNQMVDQNGFIYMTKKVALENSTTALKVIFSDHKPQSAEIKVLFKILRSDDASDFDELGYDFFNTINDPDVAVRTSLDDNDFQEYVFTAGVTDDGIGTPLPEFIQFAIKIVGQGTDATQYLELGTSEQLRYQHKHEHIFKSRGTFRFNERY